MKYFILFSISIFLSFKLIAQATFTSIATGNWTSAATWSFTGVDADGIPDSDDNVIIEEGTNVTVTSATVSCATLSNAFSDLANNNAGTLTINANGTLTILGNATIADGAHLNEKFIIRISNASSVLIFNGNTNFTTSSDSKIEINFSANGELHFNDELNLTNTKFTYSGLFGRNATIFFRNTNSATIPVTSTAKFPNISIFTSDTLSIDNSLNSSTLAGNFKIFTGVFNLNGFSLSGTKVFTLNSNCTLILPSTSSYPNFTTDSFYTNTHVMYIGSNQTVANKNYSKLTIDGTGTKTLSGTASVSDFLRLSNSTFDLNNQNFTFTSSASNHAMLYPEGGSITNFSNLVFERFVSTEGYAILGTPASGVEIEDLDDDINLYNMTGATPGGGFSNWFSYNEATSSFDSPTTTNTLLNTGIGYLAYIENGNLNLDIAGRSPSTNSSYLVNGFNNTGDGFAFIANPYNAIIGLDADNLSNLGTFGYKVNSTKDGYDAILAASTPINFLSPWQGIWIQSTGTNGSYTFNSSDIDKGENDAFNLKSSNQEDPLLHDLLEIVLTDNNREDVLYIKASEGASDNYDIQYDLEKFNNIAGQANIVSIVDGKNLSVNSLAWDSLEKESFISVYTDFPSNTLKNYTLKIKDSKDFLANNTCYHLTDLKNGNTYTIEQGITEIAFSQNDTVTSPRFKLSYSKPITFKQTNLSCFEANDGSIIAFNPNNIPTQYNWYKNHSLIKSTLSSTNDTLNAIGAGNYSLKVSGNSYCSSVSQDVFIYQPAKMNITYELSNDTINYDLSESISLQIQASSNINYSIKLEDGTIYYNQPSIQTTALQPGLNTLTIEAFDGTCTFADTVLFYAISSSSIARTNSVKATYSISQINGIFFIEDGTNTGNTFDIKVVDLHGRCIFEKSQNINICAISAKLKQAVYIIEITDTFGKQSIKVPVIY